MPSVISFDEGFHQIYLTGKRAGCIYGYPLTVGAWCNDRLKLRAINRHYKSYGDHIRYLGLAAVEPKRLARLKPNCQAPLAEWGMTEKDCIVYLEKRGLMNPLYLSETALEFFAYRTPRLSQSVADDAGVG